MKKIFIFILTIVIGISCFGLCGCKVSNESNVNALNSIDGTSYEFVTVIKRDYFGSVVYNKKTKVMYWLSDGNYNRGTLTLLVNPDGTPMIYEGENQ